MNPNVRYLIVCENVVVDVLRPRYVSLIGLMSAIRPVESDPYPLLYRELCVFLQLTGCRGTGVGHIEFRHADSDAVIFRSLSRVLTLPNDPLDVVGFYFRVRDIQFPESGLYWVRFVYDSSVLSEHPLVLRPQ